MKVKQSMYIGCASLADVSQSSSRHLNCLYGSHHHHNIHIITDSPAYLIKNHQHEIHKPVPKTLSFISQTRGGATNSQTSTTTLDENESNHINDEEVTVKTRTPTTKNKNNQTKSQQSQKNANTHKYQASNASKRGKHKNNTGKQTSISTSDLTKSKNINFDNDTSANDVNELIQSFSHQLSSMREGLQDEVKEELDLIKYEYLNQIKEKKKKRQQLLKQQQQQQKQQVLPQGSISKQKDETKNDNSHEENHINSTMKQDEQNVLVDSSYDEKESMSNMNQRHDKGEDPREQFIHNEEFTTDHVQTQDETVHEEEKPSQLESSFSVLNNIQNDNHVDDVNSSNTNNSPDYMDDISTLSTTTTTTTITTKTITEPTNQDHDTSNDDTITTSNLHTKKSTERNISLEKKKKRKKKNKMKVSSSNTSPLNKVQPKHPKRNTSSSLSSAQRKKSTHTPKTTASSSSSSSKSIETKDANKINTIHTIAKAMIPTLFVIVLLIVVDWILKTAMKHILL